MAGVSRLTDIWVGQCCCHSDPTCRSMSGFIISGSSNALSGALGVATIGSMTIGNCGHTGTVVTGSASNITNGVGKALIGSQVVGCNIGTVVSGSSTHQST
jgi:hypothetical protein